MLKGELPSNWDAALPEFAGGSAMATRAASGKVVTGVAAGLPELVGGSADLTGSNKTLPAGAEPVSRDNFGGRYLHFGIREHGMGAILNGLALHGGFRPYGGTFLVFSDYMRPAIRLAALMKLPVIYVFSHDSIGLGEDGPTHQPIEHLMSLRMIPNLVVLRPGDARETAAAWRAAVTRKEGPTALILSRQGVPTLDEALQEGVLRGGYVLREMAAPQALLLATGTELPIALAAQEKLAAQGVAARVVSLPSMELFAAQPAGYRDSVLPPDVTVRVAIEAGSTVGWERYVGGGTIIGLDHYGASAPYQTLYQAYGLTADAVVAAVLAQL
jgi:transketolase